MSVLSSSRQWAKLVTAVMAAALSLGAFANGFPEESPGSRNGHALRRMLAEGHYVELSAVLERLRLDFIADPVGHEKPLYEAYKWLDAQDPGTSAKIEEWIRAYPNSPEPFLVRANWMCKAGWSARGGAFARDTSAEQFASMRVFHQAALSDVKRALQLQPDNPVAYRLLIRVADGSSSSYFASVVSTALARYPYSLMLRQNAMLSLEPRWGGSIEAIERFALDAQRFADRAPSLRILLGYADYVVGRELQDRGDLAGAYEAYSRAIGHGDWAQYYHARFPIAWRMGQFDAALADVQTELKLLESDPDQERVIATVDGLRRDLEDEAAGRHDQTVIQMSEAFIKAGFADGRTIELHDAAQLRLGHQ